MSHSREVRRSASLGSDRVSPASGRSAVSVPCLCSVGVKWICETNAVIYPNSTDRRATAERLRPTLTSAFETSRPPWHAAPDLEVIARQSSRSRLQAADVESSLSIALRRSRAQPLTQAMHSGPVIPDAYPATPRKTKSARSMRVRSVSASRPMRSARAVRGTVVTLSIMRWLAVVNPVVFEGSMGIRRSGASTTFGVSGTTVTEAVASNRSSCTTTTGRGFPV